MDPGPWAFKLPQYRSLGLGVQGFGFRVQGLGFRVQGLGFRVSGLATGFKALGL